MCIDSSKALAAVVKDIGVSHPPGNLSAVIRVDGPWRIQNVNAYHHRLKDWVRLFKDVAARYLDSYLVGSELSSGRQRTRPPSIACDSDRCVTTSKR